VSGTPDAGPGRGWFALCAFLLSAFATVLLFWMLYRYVPLHMSLAAGMQMDVPLGARVANAVSSWLVRLMPFFVLVGLPLGALALVLVAVLGQRARVSTAAVVHWLSVLGLLVALAEFMAAGWVVYSVHQVLEKASASEGYQKMMSDLEELRRARKTQPAPESGASPPAER
jgi:hypothetical protein